MNGEGVPTAMEAIDQQKDEEFVERFERLIRPTILHDHAASTSSDLERTGKSKPA